MKKQICIIVLLLTCRICGAQNLVPNGDFEQYYSCPGAYFPLDSALNWINPSQYPLGGSPDYLNQCTNGGWGVPSNAFGYQQAHSGVGYCGISLFNKTNANFREYAEVMLLSPLIANQCYHAEMHISLSEYYGYYTTDDIGFYFSDTLVDGILNANVLPFTAQINNANGNFPDTANWILVSGNYTAAGGENYLILGNFKDDSNTDTILFNSSTQHYSAYIYIDDVSLTPCTVIAEQNAEEKVTIYPNPFDDKLTFRNMNSELSEIILYDIASRKLIQQKFTNPVLLNTEQLAKGIYIYEVRDRNGLCKKGKVVKD